MSDKRARTDRELKTNVTMKTALRILNLSLQEATLSLAGLMMGYIAVLMIFNTVNF